MQVWYAMVAIRVFFCFNKMHSDGNISKFCLLMNQFQRCLVQQTACYDQQQRRSQARQFRPAVQILNYYHYSERNLIVFTH